MTLWFLATRLCHVRSLVMFSGFSVELSHGSPCLGRGSWLFCMYLICCLCTVCLGLFALFLLIIGGLCSVALSGPLYFFIYDKIYL